MLKMMQKWVGDDHFISSKRKLNHFSSVKKKRKKVFRCDSNNFSPNPIDPLIRCLRLFLRKLSTRCQLKKRWISHWTGYSSYDSNYDSYGVSDDRTGKEMTLKKVYELALTAIAYLAFGIFVLQVIMCITAVSLDHIVWNIACDSHW